MNGVEVEFHKRQDKQTCQKESMQFCSRSFNLDIKILISMIGKIFISFCPCKDEKQINVTKLHCYYIQ